MRFLILFVIAGLALTLTSCVSSAMYRSNVETAYPPIGESVVVNGKPVHAIRSGNAAGPPVLLIHGASANAREFQTTLMPLLEGDYRVLSADRPGHGYSGRPDGGDTLGVQAAQMIGLIEAQGFAQPVIVVGHSYGGAVALRVALDRPDLVRGLVLLAPVTHDWGGGGVAWYNNAAAPPVIGPIFTQLVPLVGPRAVKSGIQSVFEPEAVPANYYERAGLALLFRPTVFRNNARDLVNLQAELAEQSERYGELSMPVIVFSGEADTVIKPRLHVYRLAQDAPDVEIISLEDGGHMPHHWHGPLVVKAIARLAGQASGS